MLKPTTDLKTVSFDQIRESLERLAKRISKKPTMVVINDAHRSTPSAIILKALLGFPEVNIQTIAIATGSHSPPTDEELEKILEGVPMNGIQLFIHDGLMPESSYQFLGTTSRGTKVLINPKIFEFECIVCINSVEPHYFAGFTGGIKSLIPGLASVKTIEKNHSWALSPASGPTVTDGNPVFEDLWECGSLVKGIEIFGVQIVNVHEAIFGVSTGPLLAAFREAEALSKSIFAKQLSQKYDMVIAHVIGPISRNLYQAQKGLENTRQVIKSGGTMVLISDCWEGIGNTAFFKTLKQFNSPSEVVNHLTRESYRFGDHKAAKFASLALEANLYICSSLSREETEQVFASKITEEELDQLIADHLAVGKSVLYVYDAGNMVATSLR